jgi:hypothetical protein
LTNRDQNRIFDEAVRRVGKRIGRALTKAEIRRLHDEITGDDYSLEQIVEIGMAMFFD